MFENILSSFCTDYIPNHTPLFFFAISSVLNTCCSKYVLEGLGDLLLLCNLISLLFYLNLM